MEDKGGFMESKIVKKNGYSVGSSVFFEAVSDIEITEEQALKEQQKLGYHPAGYGFYRFKCELQENKFVATWECQASCD